MKKREIVERLAEERHIPLHTAADLLDTILHDILKTLKEGRCAELPGIGELKAPDACRPASGGGGGRGAKARR